MYNLPEPALKNLAYYFRFSYADRRDPNDLYASACREAVEVWRHAATDSFFFGIDNGDCLLLIDLRPGGRQAFHALAGVDRLLYHACDGMQGAAALHRMLQSSGFAGNRNDVGDRLQRLADHGVMLHEGNQWLSLALAPGSYVLPRQALRKMLSAVKALAQQDDGAGTLAMVAELEEPSTEPSTVSASWNAISGDASGGVLNGAHLHVRNGREVWLDVSAVEALFWQETRLLLAGVRLK